jgi:hypothetical protein
MDGFLGARVAKGFIVKRPEWIAAGILKHMGKVG